MLLPSSAISHEEATAQGYRPLTVDYYLPGERDALFRVMADMDRGGNRIQYVLVGTPRCCAVYRKNMSTVTENSCVPIPLDSRETKPLSV